MMNQLLKNRRGALPNATNLATTAAIIFAIIAGGVMLLGKTLASYGIILPAGSALIGFTGWSLILLVAHGAANRFLNGTPIDASFIIMGLLLVVVVYLVLKAPSIDLFKPLFQNTQAAMSVYGGLS